jgi:hypothetical protein
MRLLNPHLEPLSEGGTLVTYEVRMDAGPEAHAQELRFMVRLDLPLVERLLAEVGPERAAWLLWTHFRRLTTTPLSIDSERVSIEDWGKAIDAILAEVKYASVTSSAGQADA